MKKIGLLLVMLLFCNAFGTVNAQLKDAVKDFLSQVEDSIVDTQKITLELTDSARLKETEKLLQEAKLSEVNLRMEIEQLRLQSIASDSLKLGKMKVRIDSIREVTVGVPVVVEGDTLFTLYAKRGGLSAHDRADDFAQSIVSLGKQRNLDPDSVYLERTDNVTDIMYKDKVLASFTDLDGLWQNTTRDELAARYKTVIVQELVKLKEQHSLLRLMKRILYFVLIIVLQYALYRLTNFLFNRLKKRILLLKDTRLKSISFHGYDLLDTTKQVRLLTFFASISRYLIILLQLLITVPMLFAIFPQTEGLAIKIFSYLWIPIRSILKDIIDYVPNLFTIIVICLVIKYVIRGIKYMAHEVNEGNLKINGFYPDWAIPTFHIVRFLLYAFTVAMVYPYLPGADSGIFQGISVFVGLIVSLGSSTVIGNIIAGMVITYMRPYRLGDRIKLNDTVGNVIEKTVLVTRIKTPKNELVTIPNSFIMSSHTTNYSSSARDIGLIIHGEVTIGYDTPWRKVHQLLIDAAKVTEGISQEPEPFVLETALSDYYPVYQINAYIHDADRLPRIYSAMYQNIQDKFAQAGVEIMSPQYTAFRNGNGSTIPKPEEEKETAKTKASSI